MITFELTTEYIELIKLLKITRIAESGGMAKVLVENGKVRRNGEIEKRKRAKIIKGETITALGKTVQVIWSIHLKNRKRPEGLSVLVGKLSGVNSTNIKKILSEKNIHLIQIMYFLLSLFNLKALQNKKFIDIQIFLWF